MTAKIFAYKGNLGATTDPSGVYINDLNSPGQLGLVIDSKLVGITKDAKELLKNAKREGGSFAPIMLTEHADGSGSSLGLMGFWKHNFGTDISIGRTCDKSVIDDFTVIDEEAPEDYKYFIDNLVTI